MKVIYISYKRARSLFFKHATSATSDGEYTKIYESITDTLYVMREH